LKANERLWELFEQLFPVYRTLLGDGFDTSLAIINNYYPLTSIHKVDSGTSCGSWVVPDKWTIQSAWIKDSDGNTVIDLKDSQFHLWQYSVSADVQVTHDELMQHMAIGEDGCIPLVVTYYKKRWGFSIAADQLKLFNSPTYSVFVDTRFEKGHLQVGEIFIKGSSPETVLIDAVISCNSLANNLSGVLGAVHLADYLSGLAERKYSYRILFTPETLGPIAIAYHKPDLFQNVIGGFNLINLADNRQDIQYKKSRRPTLVDQAVCYALQHKYKDAVIDEYDVMTGTCGNEKAYNSLGIEVPLGVIRRSKLGTYREYDTSADDMSFISQQSFFDALEFLKTIIDNLEANRIYKHTFRGEPFLTGYDLFPKNDEERKPYDYLMAFSDGSLSTIDIAGKSGLPLDSFKLPAARMVEKGLLKPVTLANQ
jgi:aminopeptidase-like protein